MTEELGGSALAERAYQVCREVDPGRHGMAIGDIEQHLEARGVVARGDNPRSVLQSALNQQQGMFDPTGGGHWAWKPRTGDADGAISGKELEDVAHATARAMDPSQTGIHYEDLKARLLKDGVAIKGPNQGQTLSRVLRNSARFKPTVPRKGIWVWQ